MRNIFNQKTSTFRRTIKYIKWIRTTELLVVVKPIYIVNCDENNENLEILNLKCKISEKNYSTVFRVEVHV